MLTGNEIAEVKSVLSVLDSALVNIKLKVEPSSGI